VLCDRLDGRPVPPTTVDVGVQQHFEMATVGGHRTRCTQLTLTVMFMGVIQALLARPLVPKGARGRARTAVRPGRHCPRPTRTSARPNVTAVGARTAVNARPWYTSICLTVDIRQTVEVATGRGRHTRLNVRPTTTVVSKLRALELIIDRSALTHLLIPAHLSVLSSHSRFPGTAVSTHTVRRQLRDPAGSDEWHAFQIADAPIVNICEIKIIIK